MSALDRRWLLACSTGVLALLVAFHQVVRSGVEKSEARQRASTAHADAMWRCNALRGAAQRATCHAQLDVELR
jgi:hypothetical protein